jgi:RNA polymerase sigma factor (sigma-70 family)
MDMAKDTQDLGSEAALLALYAAGNTDAARALAELIAPRILGYATRKLADRAEAEDITQEVMLRIWRAAPTWRAGDAKISTWAYKVAMNLCTDRLRRRGRAQPLDEGPEPIDQASSTEQNLIEADRHIALMRALDSLPPRQSEAVVLRHIEGLSNPDIAIIMDLGVEAVESLIARGKRALTESLAPRRAELGYKEA